MRATREVRRTSTNKTLNLKSVGLSILLHVGIVALVVGVGFNEHKPLVKPEHKTMKAVLWVPTSMAKPVKQNVPEPAKDIVTETSSSSIPTEVKQKSSEPSEARFTDNAIEEEKVSDPWLDELSALEPIEQPVNQPEPEKIKKNEVLEPKTLSTTEGKHAVDNHVVENEPEELEQAKPKEEVVLTQDEAYIDPVFAYRLDVARHIQEKWKVDSALSGYQCDVDISIMRDGTILTLNSLEGNDVVCRSAKMAIKRIRKLPAAPSNEIYQQLNRMSVRLTVQ